MGVQLLSGDDPVLVSEAVNKAIAEALGDEDRSLALQLLDETSLRDPDGHWRLTQLVNAARTEPFLTSKRVVVGRHLARFSNRGDYDELLRLLEELPATTHLVLVWERGVDPAMNRLPALPKALSEAVKAAGGVSLNVTPPRGKSQAGQWLRDQLGQSPLRFEPAAMKAVEQLVGADHGRIVGLLRTLEGALGAEATVTADDVAVYGGDPGSVVPWELDDAIDRGDIGGALEVLHRQLGSRHPLQLLAALAGRYQRMLRLDGADAADEREAAAILEMKGSTFPAKKLWGQTRRLGSQKIARAIRLLAEADLALRGAIDWPDELVMEVLVARLAALAKR
ncbi:MAG: hypothetical protein OXE79_03130 [Acidimicrobiaceae bacterium]|nr:hypothetical protein [Acidimicrobiaceae bacterium]MCY4280046.1 hypothetical protein [Acidimicrobiaceae bacterium]MCY4293649.1 hypothetical protein [Acidimicrobiaceae bacterium]